MKRYLVFYLMIGGFMAFAQGEGGVFTQSRLAALRTGEGSLGNNPHAIEWINELRLKTAALGQGQQIDLDDIEGSVYLEDDFRQGNVFYLDEPYQTFPLRYDAYNDEVEIKRNPNQLEALHKNAAISCEIANKRLEYQKFLDRKGITKEGYLFVLYKGIHHSLYLRHSKKFKEGKTAKTSLQNSFPHRFVDDKEFYVQPENELPRYLKPSSAEVIALFEKEDSKKIKEFIRSNRLDVGDEVDLKSVFVFADVN